MAKSPNHNPNSNCNRNRNHNSKTILFFFFNIGWFMTSVVILFWKAGKNIRNLCSFCFFKSIKRNLCYFCNCVNFILEEGEETESLQFQNVFFKTFTPILIRQYIFSMFVQNLQKYTISVSLTLGNPTHFWNLVRKTYAVCMIHLGICLAFKKAWNSYPFHFLFSKLLYLFQKVWELFFKNSTIL